MSGRGGSGRRGVRLPRGARVRRERRPELDAVVGVVAFAAGTWALLALLLDFPRHFLRGAAPPEVLAGVAVGLLLPAVAHVAYRVRTARGAAPAERSALRPPFPAVRPGSLPAALAVPLLLSIHWGPARGEVLRLDHRWAGGLARVARARDLFDPRLGPTLVASPAALERYLRVLRRDGTSLEGEPGGARAVAWAACRLAGESPREIVGRPWGPAWLLGAVAAEREVPTWAGEGWIVPALGGSPGTPWALGLVSREEARRLLAPLARPGGRLPARELLRLAMAEEGLLEPAAVDALVAARLEEARDEGSGWALEPVARARRELLELASAVGVDGEVAVEVAGAADPGVAAVVPGLLRSGGWRVREGAGGLRVRVHREVRDHGPVEAGELRHATRRVRRVDPDTGTVMSFARQESHREAAVGRLRAPVVVFEVEAAGRRVELAAPPYGFRRAEVAAPELVPLWDLSDPKVRDRLGVRPTAVETASWGWGW